MVLIATDVASRGIDVEGINCVINFDPQRMEKRTNIEEGELQERALVEL